MSNMYRAAIKEGTFLDEYLRYMSPMETPVAYDFWCGLWLLGSAVGRHMVIRRPKAPVFLNPYIILCADAGLTRKSTAVRLAEKVYRLAGLDADSHTVTGSSTVEGINQALDHLTKADVDAQCRIIVSELVTFLGKEVYAMSLPGYLTDMYDCPSERTINRQTSAGYTIRNSYFTLLSASTPSWLVRAINPDVIEGGFTSRCLFVVADKPKRLVAWPEDDGQEGLALGQMITSLKTIANEAKKWSSKGILVNEAALAKFRAWYADRDLNENDSFVQSFEAREDHHILRCAGLLAVNDRSYVIDSYHISHAIKLITDCKERASEIFGNTKANRRFIAGIDKLRTVLQEAGSLGLTKTELVFKTRSYLSKQELDFTLANMHELEMVSIFEVKTAGRKSTIYRGSSNLLIRHLNESLMERLRG